MSNHTPGTWEAKDQWGYIKVHSADNGVCVIHGLDSKAQANARLIASAPDLLEALEFLLADWIAINGDRITGSRVPAEKAIAAIRKAKGVK
jgi:hypothetical protein